MRKISNVGIALIKSFEGCKLTAYKPVPTEKYWTIGWGHYGEDVKQGQKISQAQADAMLITDLAKYEAYVNNPSYVPLTDKLTQNQFDALTSFCYNTGPGNLKQLCNGRTLAQIAASITKYNKAGGSVLNGLVKRRQAELDLFNTPETKKADSEDKVTAVVNGKQIEGAVLKDGIVLIPLRSAGDNIPGSRIGWDQKTKTARLDTQ
ncbi:MULTISPECIES: lysozyme [unclassified Paenibacillus]|uniref:lysozyme n=1 Tax=unclassified Paenibacillus TaxID=185978 RepID=UPI0009A8A4C1|nr:MULTISPECIES: glycoside hydrolase family protein [unclassified Paenibacillus]SLK21725.1 Phage-related lysozyme (muramidase), GH24 family [Paenibacillus sp. RU5A]SOC76717.1 Phage-related lysozyme (muramidase), GH24 family [Paenibacillus sp. RU26A]SOC78108.1 Phage-related lysozyme (muramidase), GH24 family [Paenibacillus sp. RU5M]